MTNEDGSEVHRFKSKGIELKKPTKSIVITLPEGLTEEEIKEVIAELTSFANENNSNDI